VPRSGAASIGIKGKFGSVSLRLRHYVACLLIRMHDLPSVT
jgi:hypothetical protein